MHLLPFEPDETAARMALLDDRPVRAQKGIARHTRPDLVFARATQSRTRAAPRTGEACRLVWELSAHPPLDPSRCGTSRLRSMSRCYRCRQTRRSKMAI